MTGTYLITGTTRGLGLALVKQLVSDKSNFVFATARAPKPSDGLKEVVANSNGQTPARKEESIATAAQEVASALNNSGLDVLINSARIQVQEPRGLQSIDRLLDVLNVNVVAVHNTTSAFLPLLRQGTQKKIINISTTLGSVSLKDVFAFATTQPSYKISKAALNMLTAQYALELGPAGFAVLAVSPGWMKTGLGNPSEAAFNAAHLTADEGAKAVLEVVSGATPKDNGAFRNISVSGSLSEMYDGRDIPW